MKSFAFAIALVFIGNLNLESPGNPSDLSASTDITFGINEKRCASSFNGDVNTYTLLDGYSEVGNSIWVSRKSKRAKAKYFAHKRGGSHVHDRYTKWRMADDKQVILKSSGAYATGWNSSSKPVGVTVDNGVIENNQLDSRMNGLVIVYATGGIVVSNIKDGDLYLESLGGTVDIKKSYDRQRFLQWAVKEQATVFQLHLMAYKNNINVGKYNSERDRARRKLFTLAESKSGELFHIIHYFSKPNYTMYESTSLVLDYLKNKGMNVIAMVNFDTGGYDILNTGGDATNCNGHNVWGSSNNYDDMTNLLTYEYN